MKHGTLTNDMKRMLKCPRQQPVLAAGCVSIFAYSNQQRITK